MLVIRQLTAPGAGLLARLVQAAGAKSAAVWRQVTALLAGHGEIGSAATNPDCPRPVAEVVTPPGIEPGSQVHGTEKAGGARVRSSASRAGRRQQCADAPLAASLMC
jgi:hypothetical protein